eukprot:7235021-Alexandrium_andersonii.AAC.1
MQLQPLFCTFDHWLRALKTSGDNFTTLPKAAHSCILRCWAGLSCLEGFWSSSRRALGAGRPSGETHQVPLAELAKT